MALAGLVVLTAGVAGADGFRGNLEVQYQRTDQKLLVLGADSTLRELRAIREFWSQTYELTHAVRFASGLSVFSQLRLNDVSYVKSGERARTPYGTLRLAHPWFGLAGSYQPVTLTTPLSTGSLFPALPDTAPRQLATFRTQQTLVSGYLSAPRLPRLDLSWNRRHRDADVQGIGQTGLSRSAMANWGLGLLALRGGYNDQGSGGAGFAAADVLQRAANAGAGLHFVPKPNLSMAVDYDYAQTRRGLSLGRQDVSRSHAATFNGNYTPSRAVAWALNYGYHGSLLETSVRSQVRDHEGALLLTLQNRRGVRLSSGGGVRTSHLGVGDDVLRYATAVLSWDGVVRPHWQGGASYAHVTNWNPGRQVFSIESWRAGSRAGLRKGIDLAVDWLVTDTGDTTARNLRWNTQGSVALQLVPVRSLRAGLSARQYHAGPGLFRREVDSRSTTLDLRWHPWAGFEADATFGRVGLLPNNDPRVSTTLVNVHWNPTRTFQFAGTYTRSTQSQLAGQQLTGREVYGGRMLAALGRSTTVNAGIYVADPRSRSETRQVDASVSRRFGR